MKCELSSRWRFNSDDSCVKYNSLVSRNLSAASQFLRCVRQMPIYCFMCFCFNVHDRFSSSTSLPSTDRQASRRRFWPKRSSTWICWFDLKSKTVITVKTLCHVTTTSITTPFSLTSTNCCRFVNWNRSVTMMSTNWGDLSRVQYSDC